MKNIYWYCPNSIFSSFRNKEDNPSFRLRCLNIHKHLLSEGYNSKIVSTPEEIVNADVVTLMSFGETEYNLAKRVVSEGGHVLHDYCEDINGIPILEKTKNLCSLLICASSYIQMKQQTAYGDKAVLVRDPYELFNVKHNAEYDSDILKVGWSGMGGNASWVSSLLKPIIEKNNMEYVEISDRPEATYLWERSSWYYYLASCDVCICPQIHWRTPGKSNVKVTTAMALGLPILASPLQSYLEIIKDGVNGYICYNLEDWEYYLNKLKSKELRKTLVKTYSSNLTTYSPKAIFLDWLGHVKKLFEK